MVFITKSGKEIQVPNDYTYMSIEKFAQEIYQQGRADERANVLKPIAKLIDEYACGTSRDVTVLNAINNYIYEVTK